MRKSDRTIEAKLIYGRKLLNVVSAYVPQVRCVEKDKKVLW